MMILRGFGGTPLWFLTFLLLQITWDGAKKPCKEWEELPT